ncbi:S-layer homology domain-containing protein [Paenibacillus sp. JSM ZJ436]|uniref:S-layer homology domain-containing protein n=1 Tax=Paenibacillus sp. JSM ZJ436 TaxID=3376190 RepID=UPI00379726A1
MDQEITRAEMAVLLARNGMSAKSEGAEFTDVSPDYWANNPIQQVVAAGLMQGYPSQQFKPELNVTRAEMATIVFLWKGLERSEGTPAFDDVVHHWAKSIVDAVFRAGWMQGDPDGSFKPDRALTRAEAVSIIHGLLD